jgi:hypothetical protein
MLCSETIKEMRTDRYRSVVRVRPCQTRAAAVEEGRMEHVRPTEPAPKGKRGRPRKHFSLTDGSTPMDLPTFARIKAMQAAGHTSRHVADAMQLDLALVNKVFGTPCYRA